MATFCLTVISLIPQGKKKKKNNRVKLPQLRQPHLFASMTAFVFSGAEHLSPGWYLQPGAGGCVVPPGWCSYRCHFYSLKYPTGLDSSTSLTWQEAFVFKPCCISGVFLSLGCGFLYCVPFLEAGGFYHHSLLFHVLRKLTFQRGEYSSSS